MKKVTVIVATLILITVMVLRLMHNKREMDGTLAALQQYTSVVPVKITVARRTRISSPITAEGVLRPLAEVSVLSETDGRVTQVFAEVGEHVAAGQKLASVDRGVTVQQYARAKTAFDNAKKDRERYRTLAGMDGITKQQFEAAESAFENAQVALAVAEEQLSRKDIRSPIRGTVAFRSVEKGSSLMPSLPLFTIVADDSMLFIAALTEAELAAAPAGVRAHIRFDALPGETFAGRVRTVGVVPDLAGRYRTEIVVDNSDNMLRAGISGTATIVNAASDSALVLPRRCIVGSLRDAALFSASGGSVRRLGVTVRSLGDTAVAVLGGITAGDTIVATGQLNLADGTQIRIVN